MSPNDLRDIRRAIQQADNLANAVGILDHFIDEAEQTFVCDIVWQMADIEQAIVDNDLEGKVDADDIAHSIAKVLQEQGTSIGWDIMQDELHSRQEW